MGQIKMGAKSTHTIRLVRGDRQKLVVPSVQIEGSASAKDLITATVAEDGNDAVVTLVVADTAPRGLLRGEVVIQTDHPSCKERRIGFNGFVR